MDRDGSSPALRRSSKVAASLTASAPWSSCDHLVRTGVASPQAPRSTYDIPSCAVLCPRRATDHKNHPRYRCKIVNGDEGDEETVEAAFAQARGTEAVAEDLLVDEGRRTLEVELHRNGTEVALDVGATNGHAEVEEPAEQSVLSWAELIAEEVAQAHSRRRRKQPQPASLSLFEWAVNVEEKLVGAWR